MQIAVIKNIESTLPNNPISFFIFFSWEIRNEIKKAKKTAEGSEFSYILSDGAIIFLHNTKQFKELEHICSDKKFKDADFDANINSLKEFIDKKSR